MNNKQDIVTTKRRCPKCKSRNFQLIEVWEGHTIEWDVTDGQFDRNQGNLEMGEPYMLQAECNECDHKWRFRGAIQVDSILEEGEAS